jgi:hypothetical protein
MFLESEWGNTIYAEVVQKVAWNHIHCQKEQTSTQVDAGTKNSQRCPNNIQILFT